MLSIYVINKIDGELKLMVKTCTYSIVKMYISMINTAITEGKISPKMDRWNLSFSYNMAELTHLIAVSFRPELPDGSSQDKIDQNFKEELPVLLTNHTNAMRLMELIK